MEKIRDEIIGLKPVYTEIGNSTVIYLRKGQVNDKRGIHSIKHALARLYAIDLSAQQQEMSQRLNRQGRLPFYLDANRVFVPLKMRKPRAPKDVAYGFFDIGHLIDVQESGPNGCILHLKEGGSIEVFSRPSTVVQTLHLGRQVWEYLKEERTGNPQEQAAVDYTINNLRRLVRIEEKLNDIIRFMKQYASPKLLSALATVSIICNTYN